MVPPTAGPRDAETMAGARHGMAWRAAVLLGGGVAGVIVALALSAAFAGSADAAPRPVPAVHPAADLGVVTHGATAVATPLARPVEGVVGAATGGTVDPASPVTPVRTAVRGVARSLTTTVHRTAAPVVRTIETSLPTTSPIPSPVPGGSATAAAPPGVASGPLSSVVSGATVGSAAAASPRPGPGPGPRSPLRSHRSPLPPLTANDSAELSPAGQGGSPFGALAPADFVLPALVLGALLLAREKTPLLVFHPRYSPPG